MSQSYALDENREFVGTTGVQEEADSALEQHALGMRHYDAQEFEKALLHLERAVELEPGNAVYLKGLADLFYSALQKPERALECYQKILLIEPGNSEVLLLVGNISVALNKFRQAVEHYQKLLDLEPWRNDLQEIVDKLGQYATHQTDQIEMQLQQAQRALSSGEKDKAGTVLEKILRQAPEHAIAHNDMGVLQCELGQWSLARTHFEKAVELAPEDAICLKNLADFYMAADVETEKALQLYLRVLQANPQDVETLFAAGVISERFAQLETARFFFETILEIEPWHLEAADKLAALP